MSRAWGWVCRILFGTPRLFLYPFIFGWDVIWFFLFRVDSKHNPVFFGPKLVITRKCEHLFLFCRILCHFLVILIPHFYVRYL